MELLHATYRYLTYWCKAKGANSIHSPFVFEWYQQVIRHPYHFYAFEEIENQRHRLLRSREKLIYHDLGAEKKKVTTTVSALAMRSLMPANEAIVLFQLAYWLAPKTVVELGTCLGITTAYLARATPAQVYTFEGIEAIAHQAQTVWKNLGVNNIELVSGAIENTFPSWLSTQSPKIDLLILDANHTYEATLQNFTAALPYLHTGSCIVVHDLYWSQGMTKAWSEICNHPQVTVSLDLYHFGLIFFRTESKKENFVLRW